jgi:glycosyltransferase involved in cell wall biosynthesis
VEADSAPTRIAFCITDLDPGGAEQALVQIVTRLDRREWEPAVYCLGPAGALVAPLESAGIAVTCFGARSARKVSVLWKLARELGRFRPRILQTFLYHANITGRLAAWTAGVPHVVCGIRVAERRGRMRLRIDRLTDWMVDRHVCVSESVAEFARMEGGLPARKLVVIPNGVDAARFAEASPADLVPFGIPRSARTLLFVGRLDFQKGPELLIEAADRVLTAHADAHVLLVGDGPLRARLAAQAQQTAVADRIHFAGARSDVPMLMRASYALVLPSRWEGLPNVVLEAMSAGLPVVATAVEGTREVVKSGETGWLVPPDSVDALADALDRLLSHYEGVPAIARRAQDAVQERFTWCGATRSYVDLYRSLLGT